MLNVYLMTDLIEPISFTDFLFAEFLTIPQNLCKILTFWKDPTFGNEGGTHPYQINS